MRINSIFLSFTIFFVIGLITSCATINVNVYFPAEEVRQAYTELEEEFLEDVPSESDSANDENQVDQPVEEDSVNIELNDSSKNEVVYDDKPVLQSKKIIPLKRKIKLDLTEFAVAAGNVKQQIKKEILKFPDVVKAYKNRDERKNEINALLSSGKAGEGNTGMVVERAKLDAGGKALVNAENKDRETIINGMAKAIVNIHKDLHNIEVTPENIRRVYPEAAAQFAETRRSQAPSGTPVQLPSDKWGKKR